MEAVRVIAEFSIKQTPWALVSAVVVTAAAAFYLLVLRDLALVEMARPLAGGVGPLYVLVSSIGAAGMAGCLLAAAAYRAERVRGTLAGSFAVSAVAMLAARMTGSWNGLLGAAVVAALAAGWMTVMLSMALRATLGSDHLGLWCGYGVGIAYALANLPWFFSASPPTLALIAVVAAAVGGVATFGLQSASGSASLSPDYRPRVWLTWIVVLLVLVWLDKSALHLIRAATVQGDVLVGGVLPRYERALMYFLFSVLAGLALDRGWAGRILLLATVALAAAGMSIDALYGAFAAGDLLHDAGTALYATALMMYPARSGRPWLAAGVLAVARWAGGALGAGMALELGDVPNGLLGAAAALACGALVLRARWRLKAVAVVS